MNPLEIALVPLPKHTPDEVLRIGWAALALLVTIAVGVILQRREGLKRWGLREVTLSFEGHVMERERGLRELSQAELEQGDVSMEIVSRHMGRTYHRADRIRRVIQSIFHMVVPSYHVFAVGWIQADDTIKRRLNHIKSGRLERQLRLREHRVLGRLLGEIHLYTTYLLEGR